MKPEHRCDSGLTCAAAFFCCVLLLAAVGGCATRTHVDPVYSVVSPSQIELAEETFVIRYRPDLRRLVITGGAGRAVIERLQQNLPGGIANFNGPLRPGADYVEPLRAYFHAGNRDCRITRGHVTIGPEWEFVYECADHRARQPGSDRLVF